MTCDVCDSLSVTGDYKSSNSLMIPTRARPPSQLSNESMPRSVCMLSYLYIKPLQVNTYNTVS